MKHLIAVLLASIPLLSPAAAQPASSADIAAQTRTLHNDLYLYSREIIAAIKAQPSDGAVTGPKLDALGGKLDVLHTDLQALIAQLKGGTAIAPGTVAVPAAATDYFPASAADAPFPSPENSRSVRNLDGTIGGRPYLVDDGGAIFRLLPATLGDGKSGLARNSRVFENADNNAGEVAASIIMRGGRVYTAIVGGQIKRFDDGMGGFYNTDLPALATASVGGATATPAVVTPVTPPARYAVAPGSDASCVLKAAPGQVATVLPTAHDGCTLLLDGRYAEPFPTIGVSLLVKLAAGTVLDFTNQPLALGKGGLVPMRDFEVTGPGVIMGAGIKEGGAGGTAGMRSGAKIWMRASGGVTVQGNQNGISGGDGGGAIELDDVILRHNGLGDGQTHNIYVFGGAARFTANKLVSDDPRVGHPVKSRALETIITNSTLTGAAAGLYPDDSSVLDVPDGGTVTITNTKITKLAGSANHALIGLAVESGKNGVTTLAMSGGALVGICDNPIVQGRAGTTMTFAGVAKTGDIKVQGSTATGL